MRSASASFRRTMSMRRNFVNYADMTLADGTVLHLQPEDFRLGGNTIHDDIVDGNDFTIGTALGKSVTIVLDNSDETFSMYDFYGATFFLYVGLLLEDNETVEKLRIGKFTVITPATTGSVITIEAVDNMYMFDIPYSDCPTAYPATLQTIVQNICNYCGVVDNTATPTRLRYNTSIAQRPDGDITCRQVISYVCQILCVNAKIDSEGALKFVWYTDTAPEPYMDGGNFRKIYKQDGSYATGDDLNGGDFTRQYKQDGSYATGDDFDGGLFTDPVVFHDLGFAKSVQVGTDDITITAVKVKNGDTEVVASSDPTFKASDYYTVGDKVRYKNRRYKFITNHHGAWDDTDVTEIFDYCIVIEDNPLTVDIESEVAQALWYNFFTSFIPFRPFNLSYLQDPTIESGDWVVISDAKHNAYFTFCTSVTFTTGGYMNISCNAQSPAQQFSTYSSQSARAIVSEARKTAQAISTYDMAVQRMNELGANAMGNYWQSVEQSDGSMISYMSDKPLSIVNGEIRFTQGSHVWKITGSGFFNTTNSGTTEASTTWTAGIDANNNAVMNTVSAIGINADWINTGTLKVGGTSGNVNGQITVYDVNNNLIGQWDKEGFKTKKQYSYHGQTWQRGIHITDGRLACLPPDTAINAHAYIDMTAGPSSNATANIDMHADGGIWATAESTDSSITLETGDNSGIYINDGGSGDIRLSASDDLDLHASGNMELDSDGQVTMYCTNFNINGNYGYTGDIKFISDVDLDTGTVSWAYLNVYKGIITGIS